MHLRKESKRTTKNVGSAQGLMRQCMGAFVDGYDSESSHQCTET
jgi:hypothetical protein